MPASHTDISTASPERYADGLTGRLGGSARPGTDDSRVIELDGATAEIATAPSLLSIHLEAADDGPLAALERDVTRHLGDLDDAGELAVEWHRV